MKTKTISLGIAAVAGLTTFTTSSYLSLPPNHVTVPTSVVTRDYRALNTLVPVHKLPTYHKPSPARPRVIVVTKYIKVPTLPNIYCPQEDSCRWDFRNGKVWLQRVEDRTGDKLPPIPLGPWVQVSR
jgi:hypothetical protein